MFSPFVIYTVRCANAPSLDDSQTDWTLPAVAVWMFTEFGRRLPENTSKGTNHGHSYAVRPWANYHGGLTAAPGQFTILDDGNWRYHQSDFRRV